VFPPGWAAAAGGRGPAAPPPPQPVQRRKSQRSKIQRLPYRFSIVFSLLDLASAVDPYPDSMVSLDPYPDPDSQSGSGSRRAKIFHKN
jgi:hypothetical protein